MTSETSLAERWATKKSAAQTHRDDYARHTAAAERLADHANHYTYGDGADPATGAALAAEGQVHATLALAAATMASAHMRRSDLAMAKS